MTHSKRAKTKRKAIVGLLWLGGIILAAQVFILLLTNVFARDFWDSQYAQKDDFLQARMAEKPGKPVWLVIGSSRILDGVDAGLMNGPDSPVVFNFGLGGADLLREYICLRRAIADGIKPQRVGIEVIGAFMHSNLDGFVTNQTLAIRLRPSELDCIDEYSSAPAVTKAFWWESRLNPGYKLAVRLPSHPMRSFPRFWLGDKPPYDKWGWWRYEVRPLDAAYQKRLDDERGPYEALVKNFEVSQKYDATLHKILALCKSHNINVFLLRMPESPEFRKFYNADANQKIDAYLNKITKESGVALVDANLWIAEEGFFDGHHLNGNGAEEFTRRLAEELSKVPLPH